MLILFDHGAPQGVAVLFAATADEEAEVDLLFTTDQNIRYQQNLTGRNISFVVLTGTTK